MVPILRQSGLAIASAQRMRLETRLQSARGEYENREASPCPACGDPGRSLGMTVRTIRAYGVKRCRRCRLVYTTPRPTGEELASFYSGGYFVGGDHRFGYEDYGGHSLGAINAQRMWKLLQLWEPAVNEVPHSLLDVGCATGDFAQSALNAGWQASGVEPSAEARKEASRGGLITYATLGDVTGSYGLITMFQVLEHMLDPMVSLSGARRLIGQGGLLVIEVPQWGSLGRRLRGARWSQLRPPEHITFFDSRSLTMALARSGWKVQRMSSIYEHLVDRSIEAIHRRKPVRALAYGVGGLGLEKIGLGGYLRAVASPDDRIPISSTQSGRHPPRGSFGRIR